MAAGTIRIPIPADEEERLAALHRYAILDTPPEPAFDSIVALLVDLLDAPVGTISLVERDRQWFKARAGVDACETPRSIAFCAHTIMGDEIMEIGDTLDDSRFVANPMVTGPMAVRFYAGAPLLTPEGHALGALCAYDVKPRTLTGTERRLLKTLAALAVDEMELRRVGNDLAASLRQAERANRMKSHFVAAVTHDLRSPLHTIMGFAELTQMEPSTSEACREHAASIITVGTQMLGLVNGLLDMAAAESGHLTLETAPTAIAPLVDSALLLVGDRARKGGIRLQAQIEPGLPLVKADARRMIQVLGNLLDNAVKFTPSGGTVSLSARRTDRRGVEIAVADTGVGIAQKDLPDVMEPYGQTADGRKHKGTGLGLPLARAMAEAHGATFSLDSLPGRGTTVRITFPDHPD